MSRGEEPKKNIAPINEQLGNEIEAYDQIKYIHVAIIKSRIIELINTVSQLTNIKFILHLENEIHFVNIKDIDLFAIINILIDNAVEEVKTQEEGVIKIEMGYIKETTFVFQIVNTLRGLQTTHKPGNTHKGLDIIADIISTYPSTIRCYTYVSYGNYKAILTVCNK